MRTARFLSAALLAAACSTEPSGSGPGPGADGGTDGGADAGEEAACDYETELGTLLPEDRVIEIRVDFDDSTAFDQMVAAAAADPYDLPYFPARVELDGEVIEDVAVRLKGNSSLWSSAADQTKSLKLDFAEYADGRRIHCVDKLNLHNNFLDPSIVRERLTYELAAAVGVGAPRSAHAVLFVDGARHGVFTVTEQVDRQFLEARFGAGAGADGNLYKCEDGCPLAYWGDDPTYYQGFPPDGVMAPPCEDPSGECGLVLKTNEDDPGAGDYADVIELVRTIDEVARGEATIEALDAVLDLESYARFHAIHVVLSNLDSYFGSNHNFYLYHRPTDGRFELVMWDTNLSYGTFECPSMMYSDPPDVLNADPFAPCGEPVAPLAALAAADPALREMTCAALEELLDGPLAIDAQEARIAALHDLVEAPRGEATALAQPPIGFTVDDFERAFSGDADVSYGPKVIHALRYFVAERRGSLEASLLAACP